MQLTLGLNLRDEATFDNFYSAKNTEIIAVLKNAVRGQGEKVIFLYGNRGQGLSHLLQACCHDAHQQKITSVYLPFRHLLESNRSVGKKI